MTSQCSVLFTVLLYWLVLVISVKVFQSSLQTALRKAAEMQIDNWQSQFSLHLRPLRALRFQALFGG